MNIQKLLFISFFMSVATLSIAISNATLDVLSEFDTGSATIANEMSELEALNDLVLSNGYTYETLTATHSEAVCSANLSPVGIFDSVDESPLGIGGFWWGFVCGLIGTLIILIAEDKGDERSEDVKNSLIGCLVSSVLSGIYYAIRA